MSADHASHDEPEAASAGFGGAEIAGDHVAARDRAAAQLLGVREHMANFVLVTHGSPDDGYRVTGPVPTGSNLDRALDLVHVNRGVFSVAALRSMSPDTKAWSDAMDLRTFRAKDGHVYLIELARK